MKPYRDKIISDSIRIRSFSSNISEGSLVWHRDRQDRIVEVIHGNGWMFQRDDSIPVLLSSGDTLEISCNEWHRIIKGNGNLILKILEVKDKK